MDEYKELIKEYWDCITSGIKFKKYNLFFNSFVKLLEEKLALHGQLTFDLYIKHISKYYDISQLKNFTYTGTHSKIMSTYEDIIEALFRPRFEEFKSNYSKVDYYKKLKNLYHDILSRVDSQTENLILMERCIRAEHCSGNILGIDIEKMRNEFDKLLLDKSFGILSRNALEMRINGLNRKFNAIFIDFCGIHTLNKIKGYGEVDNIFKKLFSKFSFRSDDIIGRWFSGDEIVIITKGNTDKLLLRFTEASKSLGLTFRSNTFKEVESLENLISLIDKIKE